MVCECVCVCGTMHGEERRSADVAAAAAYVPAPATAAAPCPAWRARVCVYACFIGRIKLNMEIGNWSEQRLAIQEGSYARAMHIL